MNSPRVCMLDSEIGGPKYVFSQSVVSQSVVSQSVVSQSVFSQSVFSLGLKLSDPSECSLSWV